MPYLKDEGCMIKNWFPEEFKKPADPLEVLLSLRADVGYALVQLGPLHTVDRARRAIDALVRVQCALADLPESQRG